MFIIFCFLQGAPYLPYKKIHKLLEGRDYLYLTFIFFIEYNILYTVHDE